MQVLAVHVFGVIDETGRTPHITYGVVTHSLGFRHLLELLYCEWSYVVKVTLPFGYAGLVDFLQQVRFEHTLDDVLGRTDHVIVLMAYFDLGQHGFVDVEGLVDHFYLLAGHLFVPSGEAVEYAFVNVIGPVIHFQCMCAVGRKTAHCKQGNKHKRKNLFHFFCIVK